MKWSIRILIGALVLVVVAAGAYWFYQSQMVSASSAGSKTYTQVVQVKQGSLSSTISVVGELDAVQSEDLSFSHVSGTDKLLKLDVAAGNTVKAGQVLASIDAASYQQALDQAKSDLQAAQKKLTDLQAPPTALETAQSDLAVSQATYDLEQAKQDLADLQSADLTSLKNAVQDAQESAKLTELNQRLSERDSLAKSERDLQYTVAWYDRRINELEAQTKKNAEETQELADDQDKLAETRAELARVQAQRALADTASEAAMNKDKVAVSEAEAALATAQAGGDALAKAKARLAVQTAQVALTKAQSDQADLVAGADATELATAQADVDKKQLAVTEAQAALAGAELKASFDGTVLKTNVKAGDEVTANTVVLTVANLKDLQVVASVDETTIKRVSVGQTAQISFDAFPGQSFSGKVLSVPLQGTLQGDVMVYEVPISLTGAEKLALLVGMTANVKVQVESVEGALLVPTMALTKVNGLYQVKVPNSSDAAGSAVAVPVEVGLSDGTYTQITKGLNAGDKVVVEFSTSTSSTTNTDKGPGGMMIIDAGGPPGPPPSK